MTEDVEWRESWCKAMAGQFLANQPPKPSREEILRDTEERMLAKWLLRRDK